MINFTQKMAIESTVRNMNRELLEQMADNTLFYLAHLGYWFQIENRDKLVTQRGGTLTTVVGDHVGEGMLELLVARGDLTHVQGPRAPRCYAITDQGIESAESHPLESLLPLEAEEDAA